MKKYIPLSCFLFTLTFCSCSNNDTPIPTPFVYSEENPFPTFQQESGYSETTNYIDDNNYYEIGFSFRPTAKGKINALVVNIPDVHSNIRVTIWDKSDAIAIRTEVVDVAVANTNNVIPIAPLSLDKDKEYLISMNTDDYYLLSNPQYQVAEYPIVAGNITVTGSRIIMSNSGQTMPDTDIVNVAFGICSFKFERTE